jgi:gamma-glutamyltranspeptidase/glutathione hydrolase
MSPTLILKNGQPVMSVGAAGGPKIITQAIWAIINHIDLQMPIGEAIYQPRMHHQWSPDRLYVERTMPESICRQLSALGHVLEKLSDAGEMQAIVFEPETGTFIGAHDPRTSGKAMGE